MVRGVVGGVVYSKSDSDSSSLDAHKILPFSEPRDQLSARVLSATDDDDNQSQTDNPIKKVTDAASEMMYKPNDNMLQDPRHSHSQASHDNSQNRVRFLHLMVTILLLDPL